MANSLKTQLFDTLVQSNTKLAQLHTPSVLERVGFFDDNIAADKTIRHQQIKLKNFEALSKELELNEKFTLELINLSKSTLDRVKKESKPFSPTVASRIYRVTLVLDISEKILGSHQQSIQWLKSPAKYLGGERPLELVQTEAGAEAVKSLLFRLEHSVYS